MGIGFEGDVDKAVENYATYWEAQAAKLDRMADGCESGEGFNASYTPAARAQQAGELRENARANRKTAEVNRTPEGRAHLRATGLWLAA
jgi:hypothetical protein